MFVPVFVMKASAVPNIAQTLSVWSLNVCPSVCDEGLSCAKYCTNTERLVAQCLSQCHCGKGTILRRAESVQNSIQDHKILHVVE